MKFEGILLKVQNLYSQQETKDFQFTFELPDTEQAESKVDKVREDMVGEVGVITIEDFDFRANIHEASSRESSKGLTNRIYVRVPYSPNSVEVFKHMSEYLNEALDVKIEKD
jgi:hypothetical protein